MGNAERKIRASVISVRSSEKSVRDSETSDAENDDAGIKRLNSTVSTGKVRSLSLYQRVR